MFKPSSRQALQRLDRAELERHQVDKLNRLLAEVIPQNAFYQNKFGTKTLQVSSLDEWAQLPCSQKSEWLGTDPSGIACHHTYPFEGRPEPAYRRYHRTSGTKGKPMVILDTQQDWEWWIATWQYVLDACDLSINDRILMAFSFGPFIGFWSAHDACLERGCMVIPSGGMSTAARIDLIRSSRPTILFSTPSYALHLAQDALSRGINLADSSIRQVFVAGEPGGSVPAIREKIERMYAARLMDHAGATEVGPWGFGESNGNGLHVIESEFIAEFLPVDDPNGKMGDLKELVITSLGRTGAPAFRYRTGDLVRPDYDCNRDCTFVRLNGGVLGRVDDMLVVRGVNVFPSSVDAILRSFDEVVEYRLTISRENALDQLRLEFESNETAGLQPKQMQLANQIAEKLSVQLNLRFEVHQVGPGTLARTEGKSRRIIDSRS